MCILECMHAPPTHKHKSVSLLFFFFFFFIPSPLGCITSTKRSRHNFSSTQKGTISTRSPLSKVPGCRSTPTFPQEVRVLQLCCQPLRQEFCCQSSDIGLTSLSPPLYLLLGPATGASLRGWLPQTRTSGPAGPQIRPGAVQWPLDQWAINLGCCLPLFPSVPLCSLCPRSPHPPFSFSSLSKSLPPLVFWHPLLKRILSY